MRVKPLSKKKRILFVDQNLDGGGAERVLCTMLRSMKTEEFELHLVLVGTMGTLSYLIPDTVKVHELGIRNTRRALLPFIKLVKKIRPHTVFSSLSRTTILSVLARLLCPHYKMVARYPSMPSLEKKWGVSTGWRYWLMKLTYNKVDTIIAQTEEMAKELQEFYYIAPSRITTIYNPLDVSFIEHSIKGQESPFDDIFFNIVASGRLSHEKGFDILIKAFSLAASRADRLRLHILGQDSNGYKEKLNDLAAQYNVKEKVFFYGFVKNPYPYYKYCNLFVLSSRREGFPNVLLENLYLGKKVIATNCVPVIERLFENGVNGIVVDVESVQQMGDAILLINTLIPAKLNINLTCKEFIKLLS